MKGDETEALRARLDDLARRAGRLWTPLCSRFLTQEERSLAQRCARENGVLAAFDGGSPQELAQTLIDDSGAQVGAADDRTALVLKLARRSG